MLGTVTGTLSSVLAVTFSRFFSRNFSTNFPSWPTFVQNYLSAGLKIKNTSLTGTVLKSSQTKNGAFYWLQIFQWKNRPISTATMFDVGSETEEVDNRSAVLHVSSDAQTQKSVSGSHLTTRVPAATSTWPLFPTCLGPGDPPIATVGVYPGRLSSTRVKLLNSCLKCLLVLETLRFICSGSRQQLNFLFCDWHKTQSFLNNLSTD